MDNEKIVSDIQEGYNITDNMLKLWNNMEKLVEIIARKYKGYGELEDLKQEGFIGLYDAVNHYDKNKGVPFSNYTAYWIKSNINKYIIQCERVIRIPDHAENTRRKYKKFVLEYKAEFGIQPTKGEICQFLNVDIETLDKIEKIENLARISSTDSPIESEDKNSISVIDTIPSPEDEDSIIEQIDNNMLLADVWKIVEELPELENKVISYKYRQDLETKEISKRINVSSIDVSKIHTKAIKRLKKKSFNKGIRMLLQ